TMPRPMPRLPPVTSATRASPFAAMGHLPPGSLRQEAGMLVARKIVSSHGGVAPMMFDPTYFLFIGPALLLSLWASWRTKSAFKRWSQVLNARGITGAQAAQA